jgi:hypothetical protein
MNGHKLCDVPFTAKPTQWNCDGGGQLRYDVLRRTSEDTVGLFLLTLPAARVKPDEAVELSIDAPGVRSRRWISLVPYSDAIKDLRGG